MRRENMTRYCLIQISKCFILTASPEKHCQYWWGNTTLNVTARLKHTWKLILVPDSLPCLCLTWNVRGFKTIYLKETPRCGRTVGVSVFATLPVHSLRDCEQPRNWRHGGELEAPHLCGAVLPVPSALLQQGSFQMLPGPLRTSPLQHWQEISLLYLASSTSSWSSLQGWGWSPAVSCVPSPPPPHAQGSSIRLLFLSAKILPFSLFPVLQTPLCDVSSSFSSKTKILPKWIHHYHSKS